MISYEIEHGEHIDKHTLWRENQNGSRNALYLTAVPHGQHVFLTFPPGMNFNEDIAYEYDTEELE